MPEEIATHEVILDSILHEFERAVVEYSVQGASVPEMMVSAYMSGLLVGACNVEWALEFTRRLEVAGISEPNPERLVKAKAVSENWPLI